MDRRTFISTASLASLSVGHMNVSGNSAAIPTRDFSQTGAEIRYRVPGISRAESILFIADTHLWQSDEREDPFRQYSNRMAGAYHHTQHFQTHEPTNPREAFEATLRYAAEQKVSLVVLGGDIFSYPSEAAIEWVLQRLDASGLPYVYTAGNHDWHYEGMEGSIASLRRTWTQKRLTPLYQAGSPLMAYRDIGGVRFIVLDNSTYEILPEQLAFYRAHSQAGLPCFLTVHIPLYVPGRPVGFGCGHPEWGAETDKIYQIERRERWPAAGHTDTTLEFHRAVFNTPNLLGILAGHIHVASTDVYRGIPQFVTAPNAAGGYLHLFME